MPFIGTQPEVGGYSVLDALTASATASYTLQLNSANFVPASANQLLVSLNGVIQKPGSSFTVSGSTLTFSSALTSSDSIDFIIAMGEPLLVGTPSDGTVTDAKITSMSASKLTGALPAIDGASLTGAGGMQLLLDQSFGSTVGASSVTSYDISSTYINSTYDSYFLEGYFRPSSDNKYLYMRVMVGGSVQTGNIYANESQIIGGAYSSGGENNNTTGQIAFQTSGSGNAEGEGISINIFMSNINSTIAPFTMTGMNAYANTSANMVSTVNSGSLLVANRADIVNGLSFLMHSGNIHGGNVRLYGLRT